MSKDRQEDKANHRGGHSRASGVLEQSPHSTWGDASTVLVELFSEKSFDVQNASFPTYSLFYSFTGVINVTTAGGATQHVLPKHGVLHSSNAVHSATTVKPTSFLAVHFEPKAFEALAGDVGSAAKISFDSKFIDDDPVLTEICNLIEQELDSPDMHADIAMSALLSYLSIHLSRRYSHLEAFGERKLARDGLCQLRQVLEYIEMHLTADIQLDELVKLTNLTPYSFLRLFKELTALTPHQYITKRRLETAKHLLRNPESNLDKIANDVGFASQSHFIKLFRREYGWTPNTFRRR